MKNIKVIFAILLCWITVMPGCKKYVEIDMLESGLIDFEGVFSSEESATSAIFGLYTRLRQSTVITNGANSLYLGLASDEITRSASNATTNPFQENSLTANNSTINTAYWRFAYGGIYHCNAIIEGLNKSPDISDNIKAQLTGEAKLVRGLLYFYLVNIFGDVPLTLSTDYLQAQLVGRTAIATIYDYILADLEEAKDLLPADYSQPFRKARPNRMVAVSLLARMNLYLNEYEKAELYATEIIEDGGYELLSSLNSVFLINSRETIWEIAPPNNLSATVEATNFVPASSTVRPTFLITAYLLQEFEPGDYRLQQWIGKNTVGATDYFFPLKYKQRIVNADNTPQEYSVILRLAEQYLIRAEARANLNKLSGTNSSLEDLNIIRERAGLEASTVITKEELITEIAKERRRELFCEMGHRWFDLKRTGRADEVLSLVKGASWQSTDALFPIPEDERIANPNLTQNPGY